MDTNARVTEIRRGEFGIMASGDWLTSAKLPALSHEPAGDQDAKIRGWLRDELNREQGWRR